MCCLRAYDLFNRFLKYGGFSKMGPLAGVEKALAGVFKGAPALPKNAKDWIVKYLPWLTILAAAGSAWAAWALWDWAHSPVAEWLSAWSAYYADLGVKTDYMGAGMWIAFIVMIVSAVIYLAAFAGLKATKKVGWNFLFLGTIVSLVYGIVIVFTDYGGAGSLIGAIIGVVISWYFLFQIRDSYSGK
jgi:hypothetical protein